MPELLRIFDYKAEIVWFDEAFIHTCLADGREAKMPIDWFPLLKNAIPKERNNFELINGYAIHWPTLDEDLSIEGFFKYKKNNA